RLRRTTAAPDRVEAVVQFDEYTAAAENQHHAAYNGGEAAALEQVLRGEVLNGLEVLGVDDGAQRVEDRLLGHQLADKGFGHGDDEDQDRAECEHGVEG